MLSKAQNAEFSEADFDESRLSKLETMFAHYLSSSATSSRNIEVEKKKIETLIADISHQTKTPIANLLLYTELLSEDNLTEDTREKVDVIHNQTERLRFLIDSLVKLSRLENGILSLHPKREQVNTMLSTVYEQYERKALDKGLKLLVEPTDLSAVFDLKWTTEAICNLVDNAIKYTEENDEINSKTIYENSKFSKSNSDENWYESVNKLLDLRHGGQIIYDEFENLELSLKIELGNKNSILLEFYRTENESEINLKAVYFENLKNQKYETAVKISSWTYNKIKEIML